MSDFNTQRPQDPTGPNRLRTLLIGGGIFLIVVVALSTTLLIVRLGAAPQQSEQPRTEQTVHLIYCDKKEMDASGECGFPEELEQGSEPVVKCAAISRAAVKPSDCWDF